MTDPVGQDTAAPVPAAHGGAAAPLFSNAADVQARLDKQGYLVDDGLATAIFLATRLHRPLLLEGEPGVGKTTAAKAIATALGAPLLRLQCYEGLTAAEALYEWNYQGQLLAIRLAEASGTAIRRADLFTEEFLSPRPILAAIRHSGPTPPVLLIDEIDRADDEFEALLLEVLGEWTVTIPEIGTLQAARPPVVVLTSNRSRDLHDALRRRCLYHWIDYPSPARAAAIVRRSVPAADHPLIASTTEFVGRARTLDLDKAPGLAEAIDWVAALSALGVTELLRDDIVVSLGSIAKTPDDRDVIMAALDDLGYPAPV